MSNLFLSFVFYGTTGNIKLCIGVLYAIESTAGRNMVRHNIMLVIAKGEYDI